MINYNKSISILKKNRIQIKNEEILTKDSLNRICARNIVSRNYHPSANNSAFDGFAIRSGDTLKASKKKKIKFQILKIIAAGDKPLVKYKKNSAIEIMTGAIIPSQYDTIIPVEQAKIIHSKKKNFLLIEKKIKKNQHVRFYGSDFKKGQLVIKKGSLITPSHILALKTLGHKNILVKKKPNILFFSTGNEISNSQIIPVWKVRNSNIHYLKSLDKNFLFNFYNGGIIRDKSEKKFYNILNKKLKSKFDIIVSFGAVSAGKFDFIPKIIKKFKTKGYFKGVSIRPGKPFLFSKISNKVFFGLPGNPISSAACFRFFLFPYLLNILGCSPEKPIKAILKNSFIKNKNFTRFLKAKIVLNKKNLLEVEILKGQESFRINPFISSNVWVMLKNGKSHFKKGQVIDCFNLNIGNNFIFK